MPDAHLTRLYAVLSSSRTTCCSCECVREQYMILTGLCAPSAPCAAFGSAFIRMFCCCCLALTCTRAKLGVLAVCADL